MRLFLKIWLLLVLLNSIKANKIIEVDKWKCSENGMDKALINFKFNSYFSWNNSISVIINYQFSECNNCSLKNLATLNSETNYTKIIIISSYHEYIFQILGSDDRKFCEKYSLKKFKECGNYSFEINDNKSITFDSTNYLYIGLILTILLVVSYNLAIYFCHRYKTKKISVSINIELKETDVTSPANTAIPNEKKRLDCLDTLRGISLIIMVFVNYGGGGYKFIEHQPWHGIALADFVFPWFLWIMGVSLTISISSMIHKQNKSKRDCLIKILIRFVKLFCIGLVLNGFYGIRLSELRIFGVLQRIAICFLVVGVIEVLCFNKNIKNYLNDENIYKKHFCDLIWSWKQWTIIAIIVTIWFLVTYLLPVPGCGKGYLGPGGLDNLGKYENCTGGAAGYIDKLILGTSHLYVYPTCQEMYETGSFDPEGILGTLPSIFLTYLGVQAGRIIIFYENPTQRIMYWLIWGLLTFILFAVLTFFDLHSGFIPVNKNLWTPTFSLITGFPAFFLLAILYFIIDVKKWWNGAPLIYPGMNSIVIYVCHEIFSSAFPVQWIVANTHVSNLFMDLWGSVFWTGFATFLYYKNLFFNL